MKKKLILAHFVNNYSIVFLLCIVCACIYYMTFHDEKIESAGQPGTLSQPVNHLPRVKSGPVEIHARAVHDGPGSHQPQHLGGGKRPGVDQWTID